MPKLSNHAVIIAGAGPTGLMLAGELALAGAEVAIVERRASQDVAGTRAGGLHSRTLEIFDQRGIADRFVAEGQKAQVVGFAGVKLDIGGFPTRFSYGLGLRQTHIERILLGWATELGVPILRGLDVKGFSEDTTGLDVELSDGRSLRAEYLVGCDGGRSVVRKAAGIDFPGAEPTTSNIIAQVDFTSPPPIGVHRTALGIHSFGRVNYSIVDGQIVYAGTGPWGVLVTEANPRATGEPTLCDLSAALVTACGTDYGVTNPISISRFTDAARQAATYRKSRVLIAGDAAHIHPPDGGQGLQTGIGDAVNLGWKLAQVLNGTSPNALLDTYHAERHPVGARVLRHTMAASMLRRDDDRTKALRETIAELLALEQPRRALAAELSELDIHYDLGEGHPLLGRRMPDLDLITSDGPRRVFSFMRRARPLLLNFGAPGVIGMTLWADRVDLIEATYAGSWELPRIGTVAAPAAVLIRPDGHVAWVGDGGDAGLADALTRWLGPPRA